LDATELKLLIDKTGPLWSKGALVNKVGVVFTSTSTPHGGQETILLTMMIPLAHFWDDPRAARHTGKRAETIAAALKKGLA